MALAFVPAVLGCAEDPQPAPTCEAQVCEAACVENDFDRGLCVAESCNCLSDEDPCDEAACGAACEAAEFAFGVCVANGCQCASYEPDVGPGCEPCGIGTDDWDCDGEPDPRCETMERNVDLCEVPGVCGGFVATFQLGDVSCEDVGWARTWSDISGPTEREGCFPRPQVSPTPPEPWTELVEDWPEAPPGCHEVAAVVYDFAGEAMLVGRLVVEVEAGSDALAEELLVPALSEFCPDAG